MKIKVANVSRLMKLIKTPVGHASIDGLVTQTWLNREKLNDVIKSTNGRASTHVLNTAEDIFCLVKSAEMELDRRGVTQVQRVGTIYQYRTGSPTSKAYARKAHRVILSDVELIRLTSGWYLTKFDRLEKWPGSREQITFVLTQAAIDGMVERYLHTGSKSCHTKWVSK